MDDGTKLPAAPERSASSTAPSLSRSSDDDWLAGAVRTLLASWFERSDDLVTGAEISNWLMALEGYPKADVDAACILYLRGPRLTASGAPARPIPFDIIERINVLRLARAAEAAKHSPALPPPPDPKRVRCTPEAAAKMLEESGFSEVIPFRRMPRSGDEHA